MTYIPSVREEGPYNEKNLNVTDSSTLQGFDWCAEEVVDNFFNIVEDFVDCGSVLMDFLNKPVPEDMQQEYEMEFRFGNRENEKRVVKNYGDYLRYLLLDHIERERDELVVSMIDGYNDDEE